MDKETLSHYGWIVVLVLILSVMIAMATPFGRYIATAVENTTQGLFDVQNKALGAAGLEQMENEWDDYLNDGIKNNCPIVYGQPYQAIIDGALYEYVFYKDGSASVWLEQDGQAFGMYAPVGTFIYDENTVIDSTSEENTSLTILENGQTLSDGENSMSLNVVETGSLRQGVPYLFDWADVGLSLSATFNADRTISISENGSLGEPIPTDAIEYYDNYIVIKGAEGEEDTYCPIYPDGTKIIFGMFVLKVVEPECTHENMQIINTDAHEDEAVCQKCEYSYKVIPEGATYYVGVTSNTPGDYTGATAIYTAGDKYPTIAEGDVYVYNNYEYKNHYTYSNSVYNSGWHHFNDGWGVRYIGNESAPSSILGSINGETIKFLSATFAGCTSLITPPEIPDGVTDMSRTFDGCTSLTTAPAIPDGITNMEGTFAHCASLKNYSGNTDAAGDFSGYVIPDSVTYMPSTFYGCTSLITPPEIPDGVTDMSFAFAYCTNLTSIAIPNNTTSIHRSAFEGCTSLTSITLPDTIATISYQAFNRCSHLASITFGGSKTQWNTISFGDYWNSNCPVITVTCTDGTVIVPTCGS